MTRLFKSDALETCHIAKAEVFAGSVASLRDTRLDASAAMAPDATAESETGPAVAHGLRVMRLFEGFFIRDLADDIAMTNFFESTLSREGVPYLSWSGACARLLLPAHRAEVADTLRPSSRARLQTSEAPPIGRRQRLDILFDDELDPLTATLVRGVVSDSQLGESDDGLEFKLTVWTPACKVLEFPATFSA